MTAAPSRLSRAMSWLVLTLAACMLLLGVSTDVIYQMHVLDQFYPAEALMMAILLAVISYFIFRPMVEHSAHWWRARTRLTQIKHM